MTATTASIASAGRGSARRVRRSPTWILSDSITIAWRNMLAVVRNPQLLVVDTITPIMFVLLFAFVFGGAIQTPGVSYITFLMPGIFVQTVVFGGTSTAVGLAEDLQKGIIDRFRSLPMAPSAVLIGKTFADLLRNAYTVLVMTLVGFAIGFRFTGSLPEFLLALLLITFFGYSISWLVGERRPAGEVGPGRPGGHLHPRLPADVRELGVRADRDDAGVAAADRRGEPRHGRRQRRPRPDRRRHLTRGPSSWPEPGSSASSPSSPRSRSGATAARGSRVTVRPTG